MLFAVGMSLLLFFVFIIGVMVGLHIDAYPEKIAGLPEIIRKQLYNPAVHTERINPGGEKTKIPLPGDGGNAVSLPDSLPLEEEEPTAPPGLEEKKSSPAASPSGKGKEDDTQPPKVGGKYLVQAGSFKNINKAKELSKKIIALGYKPRVATTEVAGKGQWSRVVIDGFETMEEAKKAAGLLSEKIKGLNCIVRPIK